MLFLHHLGWSHPEQMVINCRMGMGVGHQEPSQTKGCQNFINIQTTAVTTGATSFTWRVVNCNCIKGFSLGCILTRISSSIPVTLDPLQFAYHPYRSTDDAISSFKFYLSHTRLYRDCITSSEMWVGSSPWTVQILKNTTQGKYT